MTLRFNSILTKSISQLSYFVADDTTGIAAVFDARPDIDIYLNLAKEHSVSITHIFETHNHADFLSGARELEANTGNAKIYASQEGDIDYGFDHEPVKESDTFKIGSVTITAKHTPGHTFEHLSYELAENDKLFEPWGVITGDSLFVSSAGRPDLLGHSEDELVTQLHHTLYDYYLKLHEYTMIFPCHGSGSACGASIGDRPTSTIGYEKKHNPYLQYPDVQQFKEFVLGDVPEEPNHYKTLKKMNEKSREVFRNLPIAPALPTDKFKQFIDEQKGVLLDVRDMHAFAGGHIPGAINIGGSAELSTWAGWILDHEKPLLLVLNDDTDIGKIVKMLFRVGFTKFAGYLAGGMRNWDTNAYPIQTLKLEPVQELKEESADNVTILDVRSQSEWDQGHVPGAIHHYAPKFSNGAPELDSNKPIITYCGSGYRASIAASLLQKKGYQDVRNVPGSITAWKNAGYELSKD